MFSKGKLEVTSINYRNSTTKEQILCTTCRALIGFVNLLNKYEHSNIGCDLSINVLLIANQLLAVSQREATCLPNIILAQMQSTKFKKLRIIYTKGKIFGS